MKLRFIKFLKKSLKIQQIEIPPPAGEEPFLEARMSCIARSQLDCKEFLAMAITNSFSQVRCCFVTVPYQQAVKVTSENKVGLLA